MCVRYAVNVAKALTALQKKYPGGNVIRLGDTVKKTPTSSVMIQGLHVVKKTKHFTGVNVIVGLYKRLMASRGGVHLIMPVEEPKVARAEGGLTVKLQPVGFCAETAALSENPLTFTLQLSINRRHPAVK